jgi:microcystin degradation protein MlrC
MSLRLFGGGIATETNAFSPIPTGIGDFIPGDPSFEQYAKLAEERGYTYIQGYYGFAQPAGLTTRAAYEMLREKLLREIQEALPLDGVLLYLHGAMVADGYDDCETDLVTRVRGVVGDTAQIGVLLDLHCDLTQELIDTADVVITYKEYPHVDISDRAAELGRLIAAAAAGEINPVMGLFDCRMVGVYVTRLEPTRGFVDRLTEVEQRPGVLSVSLSHSFPWGDAPEMGVRALAVADGDEGLARSVAEEVGRSFYAIRREARLAPLTMNDALDRAFSHQSSNGPVVVADVADNAGGGAPSDSTFVLRELLERGAENVALAMLWDPVAVDLAEGIGVGGTFRVRLGGKMGPTSGDPLDLTVKVKGLIPNLVQRWPQTEGRFIDLPCGDTAWLQADGVDVIVNSTRRQVKGLEPFTAFGIDPAAKHVLVVKSTNHFRAAYEPIASEVIYMSAPGALTFDFTSIPYRKLDTDKYPWLDDPLGPSHP